MLDKYKKMFGKSKEIPHTISDTLEKNNNSVFSSIIKLIGVFLVDMIFIWICCKAVNDYSSAQSEAYDCLLDLQAWCFEIEDYIESGDGTAGSIDINYGRARYDECSKIMNKRTYGGIKDLMTANDTLIVEVTNGLQRALDTFTTDEEEAVSIYENDPWPKMETLRDNMAQIGANYARMVRENNLIITLAIIIAIVSAVLITVLILRKARRSSKETSDSITKPINTVAELAESMSTGSTDTAAIDEIDVETLSLDEAKRMLTSFRNMADSIAQNVDVVRRVADGDMTAFVNIRSDEDALGKNLYKMVQNNDMMFANVAEIAEGVAMQIGYIANANTSLAEGCTKQAQIVADFVEKIDEVSELISETSSKTDECLNFAHSVKSEVTASSKKMEELKQAMDEIQDASEKISAVITNIEEIASRTNLLSLNASIEAARAGEAGRGFAVVADSIGVLAQQSAQLSQESKKLIENTVNCTTRGNIIATDTFETFGVMNRDIDEIVTATDEISQRSTLQTEHMDSLKNGVGEISDTVTQNAAFSEETASMSDEIIRSSDKLKESISRFNLRQRVPGQPYIPPEKQHDHEFIAEATENYRKFQEENPYGHPFMA